MNTANKHFSYNPVEDAIELFADCTLLQALELSAIACLAVGKKAAELKSGIKPKEFTKKLAGIGLTPTEINKYIKLYSNDGIASLTALGASMLFTLSAPRYGEVRSLINELPKITQSIAAAVKKQFAPSPQKKTQKVECGWQRGKGGSNEQLKITASLPAETLSETPGVAEWVEKKYLQCGNMFGVLSDCYKDSTRLQELEARIKELESQDQMVLTTTEAEIQTTPIVEIESASISSEPVSTVNEEDIKTKLRESKSVFEPYYQLTKLACGLKTLSTIPDKRQDYEKNLNLLQTRAGIEHIWYDEQELLNNHRLVFVPGGEDFISFMNEVASPVAQKLIPTSILEPMSSKAIIKDGDQVERFTAYILECCDLGSIGWEKIAACASKDSNQLKKVCKGLNEADKVTLRQCLATYLYETKNSINQVDWLHHKTLGNALKLLEFNVNGETDCTYNSVFSLNKKGVERWHFNTPAGEVISCDRNEFQIIGILF